MNYTIKSGDTLGAIAKKYNTTVAELQRLNNISNPDKIKAGDVIKVKATSSTTSTTSATTYKVQQGDTLSGIAARFGTTVSNLVKLNNLANADNIQAGQTLKIKGTASSSSNSSSSTASTYTVKSGDTLGGIAAKFGTTVSSLQQLNGITNPDRINAGDILRIKGTTTTSSSSSTTTYIIKNGDTLSGIAARFGTTVSALQQLNGITNPDRIEAGQTIRIKGTATGNSSGTVSTYTVKNGDTLSGIAAKFGTTVANLQSLNGISNPNFIKAGDVLRISGASTSASTTSSTSTYVVKSGDTLSGIAARFGTTVASLQSLNGISNPNQIYAGQTLIIYGSGGGSYSGGNTYVPLQGNGYLVTSDQLRRIGWTVVNDSMVNDLNNCLRRFNITTLSRIRHFISQCSHESAGGVYTQEIDAGYKYENNVDDLGNTQPGDGPKFKGAGYIQVTGRYNYTQFANYIGDPKVVTLGVSYVAANYPWTIAGHWWYRNGMNSLIDNGATVKEVTKKVNGGYNGLAERQMYYNRCVQVITSVTPVQTNTGGSTSGSGSSQTSKPNVQTTLPKVEPGKRQSVSLVREIVKTITSKNYNNIISSGFTYNKELILENINLPQVSIKITLNVSNTLRSRGDNIVLIFDKNGNYTAAFERTVNELTTSNEISGTLSKFGKQALINRINDLSTATKYGNIYMKYTINGQNNIKVSFIVDSKERTVNNSGIIEQISCELVYDITLKNSTLRPSTYQTSNYANVAFALVVVAVVGIVVALSAPPTTVVAAAGALLIWIGTKLKIIDKK